MSATTANKCAEVVSLLQGLEFTARSLPTPLLMLGPDSRSVRVRISVQRDDGHTKTQLISGSLFGAQRFPAAHGRDHCTQQAVLRQRLLAIPCGNRPKPFDISRLITVAGSDFRMALQNHLNAINETAAQVPSLVWHSLASVLVQLTNTHLGKNRWPSRNWLTENTLSLFDECRNVIAAGSLLYRDIRRNDPLIHASQRGFVVK